MTDLYDITRELSNISSAISYVAHCSYEPCYVRVSGIVIDVNKITTLEVVEEYYNRNRTHHVDVGIDGRVVRIFYGTEETAVAVRDQIEKLLPAKVKELEINTPA